MFMHYPEQQQTPPPKPQAAPPKPQASVPEPRAAKPGSVFSLPWTLPPLDPGMTRFLKGLAIIAGLNTLATLARAFTFAAAGMAAAKAMHRRLLAAVLNAPLSAFDTQPAGRLLNR